MADRIGVVASRSSSGTALKQPTSHQSCPASDKQRQLINMPSKSNQIIRPKTVVMRRQENHGFGFTLRHFIVYPPDANDPVSSEQPTFQVTEPMDTVFVKEVRPNGPAHLAGLQTGDRLLTVNGIAIGGMPYAHVVSIIQQVPAILTLQVVPKECDVLQTYFSETAHNPETNQRPRPTTVHTHEALPSAFQQIPRQSYPVGSTYDPQQVPPFQTYQPQHPGQSASVYRSHEPSEVVYNPLYTSTDVKPVNRRESQLSTVSSTTVSSYDSQLSNSTTSTIKDLTENAIMMRWKKNFEQKEEFLRRPNQQPLFPWVSPPPSLETNVPKSSEMSVKQREFYARPKKMQKQIWPPHSATNSPNSSGQFDGGLAASLMANKEEPKFDEKSLIKCDRRPTSGQLNHFIPIQNNKENEVSHAQDVKKMTREQFFATEETHTKDDYNLANHPGLHIVSERTKMFESGRPLSPDGNFMDRTQLYKSELSRLNNKVAIPNVAHRKKEFEQISLEERERSVSLDHSDLSRRIPRNGHYPSDRESAQSPYKSADRISDVMVDPVKMRPTKCAISLDDEERRVRRISYLRATANEGSLHSDQATDTTSYSSMPSDVLEEDKSPSSPSTRRSSQRVSEDLGILLYPGGQRRDSNLLDVVGESHSGNLQVKITLIDGKRNHDRSWKNIWAIVTGHKLKMMVQREGKPNQNLGDLDLRNFNVADANYTKRKHVFKLISIPTTHVTTFSSHGPTELLLQAESEYDMNIWRDLLQSICDPDVFIKKDCVIGDVGGGQIAEPQTPSAAIKAVQTPSATSDDSSGPKSTSTVSKKYYLGSRSPSGQSPVTKSRKTPQQLNITVPNSASGSQKDSSDKEGGSPKPKTWKGLVARQLRKIQGQPASGQGSYPTFPEGASIGVPLSHCVPSEENECVPMLVARCTSIVEQKGLDIVGIYRIPGNTAAIAALTEQVNRGFDDVTLMDPKWEDVNVVSSLLKSFIRNLPEPLLPIEIYMAFINADKKSGRARMSELKTLLNALPPFSYETMKHLLRHLHRVSQNCHVNLMEPKNLAIIFGPSIVRSSNETLETAVKDMKHQCRIVESLVTHYGYFFEKDPIPDVAELPTPTEANKDLDVPTTNLLLDNVAKIEPFKEKEYSSKFVASIVQAANRKIRKSTTRKQVLSTGTPDNLSLDSNTSTESKDTATALQHMESSKELETLKHRLSEDDSNESTFVENGSMSLTTVTIALDNKLKSLRCSLDSSTQESEVDGPLRSQALGIGGENLPFADESPERSLLSVKMKSSLPREMSKGRGGGGGGAPPPAKKEVIEPGKSVPDDLSSSSTSSSSSSSSTSSSSGDTDTSTTSIPIHIDSEVLRKMNRILTNLERNTTKMNRSLSLNYKSQQKGGECCCHVNHRVINRVPLTKDEKTDKNINKKRHSQETKGHHHHHRRYDNRSIRRRHTVGGTHDYSPKYIERSGNNPMDNYSTPCRNYVMRRSSSPE